MRIYTLFFILCIGGSLQSSSFFERFSAGTFKGLAAALTFSAIKDIYSDQPTLPKALYGISIALMAAEFVVHPLYAMYRPGLHENILLPLRYFVKNDSLGDKGPALIMDYYQLLGFGLGIFAWIKGSPIIFNENFKG